MNQPCRNEATQNRIHQFFADAPREFPEFDAVELPADGLYGWDLYTYEKLDINSDRCFDPKHGRWLCEEPMALDAGEENLYPYPNNGR